MRHMAPKTIFSSKQILQKMTYNHLDWWNYGETYLLQSTKWIEIRLSTEILWTFLCFPVAVLNSFPTLLIRIVIITSVCLTLNSKVLGCQTERQAYFCLSMAQFVTNIITTVDGRNPAPVDMVVYPNVYRVYTTWDVWNPTNNGIFTISSGAGSQPSTVSFKFGSRWKGGAPFLRRGTSQAEPGVGWFTIPADGEFTENFEFLKVNYSEPILAQILLYSHFPRFLSKVYLQLLLQDYRVQTCFWVGLHLATLQILVPQGAACHASNRRQREATPWRSGGGNGSETGGSGLGGGSLLPTGDGFVMNFCLFVV